MHKQAMVGEAKRKGTQEEGGGSDAAKTVIFPGTKGRSIEVPNLLTIFCNTIELMRLRHEIILAATECCVLQEIYLKQAETCKLKNLSASLPDSISFEAVDIHDD